MKTIKYDVVLRTNDALLLRRKMMYACGHMKSLSSMPAFPHSGNIMCEAHIMIFQRKSHHSIIS